MAAPNEEIDLNQDNSTSNADSGVMDDNEVAALLASLKHKKPPNNDKEAEKDKEKDSADTKTDPPQTNTDDSKQETEPKTPQNAQTQNASDTIDKSSIPSNAQIQTETDKKTETETQNQTKNDTNDPKDTKDKTDTKTEMETDPKSRKRTFSEMESQTANPTVINTKSTKKVSDPRAKRPKTIIKEIKPINKNKNKKSEKTERDSDSKNEIKTETELKSEMEPEPEPIKEPFTDMDWSQNKFIFIRLTYFNKRKSRKFPLHITDYAQLTQFVQFYFPSLTNCKWHIECDENWIESLQDYAAIVDEHTQSNTAQMFLELMIINESLPIKSIYAPKAVYITSPYKCPYPPISDPTPQTHAQPPMQPIQALQPPPQPIIPVQATMAPPFNPYMANPYPYMTPQTQPQSFPMQAQPPSQPQQQPMVDSSATGGYHTVSYPHYLAKGKGNGNSKGRRDKREDRYSKYRKESDRNGLNGAVCPDPTTYLPFAHAGQSTPQMRTLHKIVWVLQHQKKALNIEAIRQCLPGKKKAQINEIDYLLSSYESYNYTKSTMVSGRKVWQLCPAAFPSEFWNMQWQRTN